MLLQLDGKGPQGRQVVARIQTLIASGALPPGSMLPSTRALADQLGLHRGTIAQAYQTLWALGCLELRQGAQPRVRARGDVDPVPVSPSAAFDWASRLGGGPYSLAAPEAVPYPFTHLGMDPRLMPLDALSRCLRSALRRQGPDLLAYGDPQGFEPLRAALARRMGQHGVAVAAEQVLVTLGAQQALDLVLRALAKPGDAILVEDPTYDQWLRLMALHRLRPVAIPGRPGAPDLEALEGVIRRERPVLLYTMPSFQNPTGRSLPPQAREGLLAVCGRHVLPILEDAFEEEMKYYGRPIPPLAALDRTGLVLYVGTFSKILAPGLRVGWISGARDAIQALTALRRPMDLGPSPLLQAALEDFLRAGHLDRHLARLHRAFRRRMDTALGLLRKGLDPERVAWEAPDGGYLVWLELQAPRPRLERALARAGLSVRHGGGFFLDPTRGQACLRLSLSHLDETEIRDGLGRLIPILNAP